MAAHTPDLQRQEKLAGLLLIAAAALALLLANSGLSHAYHAVLETKFGPAMPRFGIMSVHYWIADGLMAVFFLLVGLEVKREWYDGQLAHARNADCRSSPLPPGWRSLLCCTLRSSVSIRR